MFSLSKLSVFAAVAFSALTSAIPLNTPVGDLPVPALPDTTAVTGLAAGLPVGSLPALGGLLPRTDAPQSIAVVLTAAHTRLVPLTNQLKFVTAQNMTVDCLAGPIGEIKDILVGSVTSLKFLVGQPAEVILLSVEGTVQITVAELGRIVAGVVFIVFEALGAVLRVAGATIDKVLFDLLVTVGVVVGSLLAIVFSLVGTVAADLLAVVVPLLKTVIPFILHLNLATVISILHLN
jgi:hypothetical protein